MKKLLAASAGLGLMVLGGFWWAKPSSVAPAETIAPKSFTEVASPAPDSTFFVVTGVVGAGGTEPVRAHTTGRVRKVYFTGGEYARGGQVLAKLYNHTYVLAPRSGFLGPCQITIGQYLAPATVVTTVSRRSHLVVPVALPPGRPGGTFPGDSARVWVAARPARVATGVVGPSVRDSAGIGFLEILLASRAPFQIGERACVQLRRPQPQMTAQ